MNIIDQIDQTDPAVVLNTYSALLSYVSNKKYGIPENNFAISSLIDSKYASKIISELNSDYQINLFKLDTKEDFSHYEEILNSELTKFTKNNLSYNGIEDEIRLISNVKNAKNTILKDKEITISTQVRSINRLYRQMGFTFNKLVSYCKKPSYIHIFTIGNVNFYIVTRSFKHNKEDRFLLARIYERDNKCYIVCALVARTKKFYGYIDNPARMFLLFLDDYGLDLQIAENKQKYYFEISIPILTEDEKKSILIQNNLSTPHGLTFSDMRDSEGVTILCDTYSIDFSKYRGHFKRGII